MNFFLLSFNTKEGHFPIAATHMGPYGSHKQFLSISIRAHTISEIEI